MAIQQYPQPTVGAYIYNRRGEILLVKTHKWPGKWVVCGGKVELGETLIRALKREVKEEVGLDITDIRLVAIWEFIHDPAYFRKSHFIFFDYFCRAKTTKVILQKEEAEKYIWIHPSKALKLPLEKFTKKTIIKIRKTQAEIKIN